MVCSDFRRSVYTYMGAKFLVVAPSTESFLILENITNNILENLGNIIVKEYRKSPPHRRACGEAPATKLRPG